MPDMYHGLRGKHAGEYYFTGWQVNLSLLQGNFKFISYTEQVDNMLSAWSASIIQRKFLTVLNQCAKGHSLLIRIIDQPGIVLRSRRRSAQTADGYFQGIGMPRRAILIIEEGHLSRGDRRPRRSAIISN